MSQSNAQINKFRPLAVLFRGLLYFVFVGLFVSWVVERFVPYGNTAPVVGLVSGFIASRMTLDRYHPVIAVLAVLLLADTARVEWFPSEKSCRSMDRKVSHLQEQQIKATEYWQRCIAPDYDQQEYCADSKPERTIESLAEEWEYLSDRSYNRCYL